MQRLLLQSAALPLVLLCTPTLAQTLADAPPPPPAMASATDIASAPCCVIPVGTVIDLEIVTLVSSKTARRGDEFPIRLAAPLVIDGKVFLPAGVTGVGQVVHAAGPSIGGKPGELILAARYLQFGDIRVPLKGMRLGSVGRDNGNIVLAASMVSPVLMFIPGGHVQIAAGARANAKLAAELTLTPLPPEPLAATATTGPAAPATATTPISTP